MPSADPVDAPACAARTTFSKESTAPAERSKPPVRMTSVSPTAAIASAAPPLTSVVTSKTLGFVPCKVRLTISMRTRMPRAISAGRLRRKERRSDRRGCVRALSRCRGAGAEETVLAMAAVLQLLGRGRLQLDIAQHGRENALRRQIGTGQLARHPAPIEHDDAVTDVDQLGDFSRVEQDAFAGSGVVAHQDI